MSGLTPEQGRILLLGKYSDLTLVCKEVQFKVHKSVVCVASPVIDNLCSAHPEDLYIQVPDPIITPNALARLLEQIYTGSYPLVDVPLVLKANNVAQAPKPASPASHDSEDLNISAKNEAEFYFSARALEVDRVATRARATILALSSSVFDRANALTGFADVLAFIFESTKSGHDFLREEITKLCLQKHSQCSKNAAIVAVLEEHERSLWKIAVPLLRDAGAKSQISATAVPPLQFSPASIPPFGSQGPLFNRMPAQKSTVQPPVPTHDGTKKIPFFVTEEKDGDRVVSHFHSISMMPAYQNFSVDELRLADYSAGLGDKPGSHPFQPISSSDTPLAARSSSGPRLFSTSATASSSAGLFSTPAPVGTEPSVPKGPLNLPSGGFQSLSSKPPAAGLFGGGTSTESSGGLHGSSHGSYSFGGFHGFTFGNPTYKTHSAGLFSNLTPVPKEPLIQTEKPTFSFAVPKPPLKAAASPTEEANGSTGSHN